MSRAVFVFNETEEKSYNISVLYLMSKA